METPASSYDPLIQSNLHSRVGRASQAIPRPLQRRLFILALLLSDFLMIGLGFRLAYWVRFELSLPVFVQIYEPSMVYYSRLVMILLPLWLIIFAIAFALTVLILLLHRKILPAFGIWIGSERDAHRKGGAKKRKH